MTDPSSASSPLVLPPVSDALLERVVATILESPPEEPNPYRARLDQFLATTPVRGFRKASSAPLKLRCDLVRQLFRRNPTAAFELLLLWRSLRGDLASAVGSGEEADPGPEIEREERELMAAVLAWEEQAPGPEEPGEPGDEVEPLPSAFVPAFEVLAAIPATDRCWEEIETAVTALQTLAAGKIAAPERLRERVRHSLEETIARRQELLTYFGFQLAPSDLEGLAPEALVAAESWLPELDAALERYLEVKGREAASVVEDRQRRDQLGELEERIEELRNRWQGLGAPPPGDGPEEPPPPTPPGDPQPFPPDPIPPTGPGPGPETIEELTGPDGEDEAPPPPPGPIPPIGPGPSSEPIEEPTGPGGKDEAPTPSPNPIKTPEPEPGPEPTPPVEPDRSPEPPPPALEGWAQLCWEMVGEGDTAGAYWLARSREARGESPPIAPWLLGAVHASSRLEGISGDLVRDLREITEACALPDSLPEHLLALSAGLRGALVAPGSGLLVWVEEPARRLPALVPLAQAITAFAQGGKALGPEDAKGVRGLEAMRQQVSAAAGAAKRAMDEATKRRFKLARASDLVNHLFRTELVDWLGAVARNETAKIAAVRDEAGSWRDRERVMRRIGELDRQLHGNRAQRIVGDAREQILRLVGELCDRAEAWCDAAEQLALRERKGDWYQKQVDQLRSACEAALPTAVESLASLKNHGPALGGAARCLTLALGDLAALLAISVAPTVRRALAPVPPEGPRASLEGLLAARLLSVPGAPIGGRIDEDPAALEGLDEALRRSRCLTLPEIVEQWLDRGDFRPVASLLDLCPDESRQALAQRAQAAQDDWRRRLRAKVEATRGQIEQALVDGVIGPGERAEHTAEVERLSGVDEPRPGPLVRRLEAVQASLGKRTAERVEELRQRWQLLAARLPEAALTPEQESAIFGLVEGAITRCDCRLAEELLAELPTIIDRRTPPPKTWFEKAEEEPDSFREFLKVGRELETVAQRGLGEVVRELRTRGEIRGLRLRSNLPRPRLEEAVRGLEAWRNLKGTPTPSAELARDVAAVLTYLGFSVEPSGVSPGQVGAGSLHLRVRMSAGGSSLTPEFGSQSRDRYDVVCVWERPPGETLAGLLDQLGIDARPVLVLYLARLTPVPRRRLFQAAARRLPAMLVVDEALMLHLVGELDSRLRTMMRCTLPYSSINPYTPFQPGEVPPEMFYGRREMLHELARAEGPCLLYGGRQLGKSALLRAVERKFHRPEREELACVLDIKLLGDPAAGQAPEQLWPKLRDALKGLNVLARQVSTDKAEDLLRYVGEWLRKAPSRRLLVMFDEADNFLDADARSGFRAVTLLRELMTGTQRRFKVVFTGLHNVQRFNGIPNQPLAHFGGLQIEPLEPDEAFRLVERPFGSLGFRFESREAILQVLSYTNYHPGLVQLFCKSLLDRLRGNRETEFPHDDVRLADIEAVYRDPRVQQEIRTRLDWTLALDPRYQAIAWSLVFDQMGSTDGFARAYPRAELLRLLRDNWPLGFGAVAFDDLTGLLDEMCGLGILVRDEQGRYRLRSPNLVRLMGTEEDIVQRLAELAKAPPPLVFDADSHHALLRDQAGIHSPFTHAMERQLAAQRSGVALVFASAALGLGVIPEALRRLRRDAGEGSLLAEIPGAIRSGVELSGFLREDVGRVGKSRYSFLYQRVGGQDPLFVERFREAVRACRSASRSAILRVVFLLDPDATFSWLEQPAAEREQLEEMADAVLSPHRWNEAGIRQWLEQRERVAAPDVIASVLGATGGWLPLLEVLGDRARGNADVVGAAELLGRDLDDSGSEQAASFQQKLGVEGFSDALEVLRTIHTLGSPGPLHAEDLTPDLVENRKLEPESLMAAAEFLVRMGVVAKEADGVLRAEPVASRVLLR